MVRNRRRAADAAATQLCPQLPHLRHSPTAERPSQVGWLAVLPGKRADGKIAPEFVADRRDMRVDAPQIAQDSEMQCAGFQPAGRVSLQSIEAAPAPACRPLNRVQPTFGVGKVYADLGSSVMKVRGSQPEILEYPAVKVAEVSLILFRQHKSTFRFASCGIRKAAELLTSPRWLYRHCRDFGPGDRGASFGGGLLRAGRFGSESSARSRRGLHPTPAN